MKASRVARVFTTAEDWIARFLAAGCSMQVSVTMTPEEGKPASPECEALWNELRGPENEGKLDAVHGLIRSVVGPAPFAVFPEKR
jgi:hypothetical protein